MRKCTPRLDFEQFIGKQYGSLTFLKVAESKVFGKRRRMVEVECICGVIKDIDWDNLRSGKQKSCGCGQHKEKWAGSDHPLKRIWTGIKQRCYNPNSKVYCYYGAKGVIMCDEWLNSYRKFYYWCISNGWEEGLEVDKDIKGNGKIYSPESCMIVTHAVNVAAITGRRKASKEIILLIKNSKVSGRKLEKTLDISRGTITKIRNNKY